MERLAKVTAAAGAGADELASFEELVTESERAVERLEGGLQREPKERIARNRERALQLQQEKFLRTASPSSASSAIAAAAGA